MFSKDPMNKGEEMLLSCMKIRISSPKTDL